MRKMRLYKAAVSLLLLAAFAVAEESGSESLPCEIGLRAACMLALTNNPVIQAMREQIIQQDGALIEAHASMYPRLTAGGQYMTFDTGRLQSFGEGFSADPSRWDGSVDLGLTIFSGGRNNQYVKAEQARLLSIGSSVVVSEEALLVAVHKAYYEAWLSDQRVDVQKEAISVLEEQLQVTKNRFNAGVGEKYDVTQAEVALANARPPLIRALNDRRRSTDRLQEIIGLPYPAGVDASGIKLQSLSDSNLTGIELGDALDAAMKNRPEIKRAMYDHETAQREIKLMQREQSPVVDIFANYGAESDMFGAGAYLEGWSTGVRLNWSLFDGGIQRGKVQQARSRARQVEFRRTELGLAIEGEVRKAYYDQQEASAILEVSEKVILQARESLQLARNRYKAGKGTQLEVLESQLQLTRAQLERSSALHDLALASVQMKRAIGESIVQR